MVRNARPRIVGSNYADRQRYAGYGEAKRADKEVATGCDQF